MINILLCILAIFFPPLPVAMLKGVGEELLISVLLTLLAWLPGLIYALWVIFTHEDD